MKTMHFLALALSAAAFSAMADEWFVDAKRPDDSGDGSSVATAKKTLSGAMKISSLKDGDVVTVLPGEYCDGTTGDGWSLPNRLYVTKSITVRSRDGAAATHIVGKFSAATAKGLGSGGVRCVYVNADNVVVQGFTLRDGATLNNSLDHASCEGGGVLFRKSSSYLVDCVISNCVAGSGAAAACDNDAFANSNALVRTMLFCNNADKYDAVRSVALYHCIASGHNDTTYPPFYGSGNIINCTLFDNYSHHLFDGGNPAICNTIIGKYCYTHSASSGAAFSNCVSSISDNTNLKTDSNFINGTRSASAWQMVAPSFGDYRLVASCAAAAAGSADHMALIPDAYRWTDIAGMDFSGAETICAGAVQETATVSGGYISLLGQPSLLTSSVSVPAWSMNGMLPNGGADIMYARNDRWPTVFHAEVKLPSSIPAIYGFKCAENGVASMRFPLFGDGDALDMVANPVSGKNIQLTPVAADALYYVSPEGDDGNAGTEESPFLTIQAAVDAASEGENTVIRVLPGVYRSAGRAVSDDDVKTSVVLPNGKNIRLVAVCGPSVTAIEGMADGTDTSAGWNGCGTAAVRCVWVGTNCVVQGFTLRNGHAATSSAGSGALSYGGGVYAADSTAQIVDCVVSNCFAGRAGAGIGGTWQRCRISRCGAEYMTSALRDAAVYNCHVDDNVGQGTIFNFTALVGVTVGADNLTVAGGRYAELSGVGASVVYSLLMGRGCENGTLRYCVYPDGYTMPAGHVWTADCLAVAPSQLVVEDGVPLAGTNPAVDFLSPSSDYPWGFCGFYDVDRNPRVMNGKMDAGAIEANLHDLIGDTLGRRCAVTNASMWVKLPGDGTVHIEKGDLGMLWMRSANNFSFRASVTGTGTLVVLVDGVEMAKLTSADGEAIVRFSSVESAVHLAFTYEPGWFDTGSAVLSEFLNEKGLIVRMR